VKYIVEPAGTLQEGGKTDGGIGHAGGTKVHRFGEVLVVEKLKREGESLIGGVNWELERERRPHCCGEEAIYVRTIPIQRTEVEWLRHTLSRKTMTWTQENIGNSGSGGLLYRYKG
jgi:hypothetical protein